MALPGGRPQDPPAGLLQQIRQWAGFTALLTRFGLAGVLAWFTCRLTRKV